MRIGFGNDIHRLESGRELKIGGITIPSDVGEVAHSDGDVLIHAIIDALLGATANGDIGKAFPDSDERYKGADSLDLLQKTMKMLEPIAIINIDTTITLEHPKLSPYIPQMREKLASVLQIPLDAISIKAKTNEGLGPIGEGKAIKAEAVVLIG